MADSMTPLALSTTSGGTEPLYVTEKDIVRLMGTGINSGHKALREMKKHPNFPPQRIGGKRYWPLVRDFIDGWNRGTLSAAGKSAGQEDDNGKTSHRGRAWSRLEAAKERMGRDLARKAGAGGGRV